MSTLPEGQAPGGPQKAVYINEQRVDGGVHIHMDGAPAAQPALHQPARNLPPREDTFAGRESELRALHECLGREALVGVTQQAAVHSHGGVGKTSLAIEYGWRHLDDYPGGVFFLSCERAPVPPLAELAPYLGLRAEGNAEETAALVKVRLESGAPSLLVLDNVEGSEQWLGGRWNRLLPQSPCRRLVTTRASQLANVRMIPLERLSSDDGLELLTNFRADARHESDAASAIVEWFDGLAVGLTVVGVYMQMNPALTWQAYADDLARRGLDVVRATEEVAGATMEYEGRAGSVFDDVLRALPAAERRALEYAALLPEDNVYAPWIVELLDGDGVEVPARPGYADVPARQVVEALISRQLLRPRGEDQRVLGLHRVLRRHLAERLPPSLYTSLLRRIEVLAERRGKASRGVLTNLETRVELTPLMALAEELDDKGQLGASVRLTTWVAESLRQMGRYLEALMLLDRFVGTPKEESAGPEEAGMLLGYSAGILQELGDFIGARRRMESAIAIFEAHLPENDLMLATSYADLAAILRDLGELSEAGRRIEQAIAIQDRRLPPNHPERASAYSIFGTVLRLQGELSEARRYMEQAIEIDEQQPEPSLPTLAIRYSNLAWVLMGQGEMEEARHRMEQAISIDEQVFAPDHPELATSYNNLGQILWALNHSQAACALFRRADAILRKNFPPEHPRRQIVSWKLAKYCAEV